MKAQWRLETQAPPSHLAGVLARLPDSGAQHGVRDVARVGVLTVFVLDDGDVGASQGVGQAHCGDVRKECGGCQPPGSTPSPQSSFCTPHPGPCPESRPHVCLLTASSSLLLATTAIE